MKAIAYIRVSTNDQKLSPAAQKKRIRLMCESKGWAVARFYEERGLTGRNDNRPELERALSHVCKRGHVLVVYSLSRLVRSAADSEKICERLEKAGASLASCMESIDTTTAMGKAFFGIAAIFARLESDLISERVKAVNSDTTQRLGYRTQGRQPIGWKIAGGRRVPCERERALVSRVAELNATHSLHETARILQAAGEPTITAMRGASDATGWTARKVLHLLKKSPAGSAPHGSNGES
jgi:site-specific DNA recombinase